MSAEEASSIARAAERIRRNGLRLALPSAAILGAGAALAVADVSGGGNTITGCFVTAAPTGTTIGVPTTPEVAGELRVINPNATQVTIAGAPNNACMTNEQTITWGQQGPTGAAGTNGTNGAAGAQGLNSAASLALTNSAGHTYLKIDSIPGSVSDKDHKDWIEVSSFSWGASNSSPSNGSGGQAVESFSIRRVLDSSSPKLLAAATSGASLGTLKIDLTENVKGQQKSFIELKLDNATITNVSDAGGQEVDTFTFLKGEETFLGTTGGLHSATIQVQPNVTG